MIKLIKPDKFYPNMKSEIVILFSAEKSEVTLEEYYNPHFIYINFWKRTNKSSSFNLMKSFIIPLNRYARSVYKLIKQDRKQNKRKRGG